MSAIHVVDLHHLGQAQVIGAWTVDDRYLIDPGPATAAPKLLGALGDWRPKAILITHIHLDHAGAVGLLARSWPETEIWVHERGATHLMDPARLIASARRVYGAALDELWGEPTPVLESQVRVARDAEEIGPFQVAETPGHASHHVSYFHSGGTAFVGDVAGIRVAPGAVVLAPTVPPEFEPSLWKQSLARIRRWAPSALALTHFGRFSDVGDHLDLVALELDFLLATGGEPSKVSAHVAAALHSLGDQELASSYRHAARPETFVPGIKRYLARAEGSAHGADAAG